MSTSSRSSSSSSSTSAGTASPTGLYPYPYPSLSPTPIPSPNMSGQKKTTPPTIAALPSFAHSLSAFPNMTAVANDMVHYGTLSRTKQFSEDKLNTALQLQATRQRSPTSPTSPLSTPPSPLADPLGFADEDGALTIPRRKKSAAPQSHRAAH